MLSLVQDDRRLFFIDIDMLLIFHVLLESTQLLKASKQIYSLSLQQIGNTHTRMHTHTRVHTRDIYFDFSMYSDDSLMKVRYEYPLTSSPLGQ